MSAFQSRALNKSWGFGELELRAGWGLGVAELEFLWSSQLAHLGPGDARWFANSRFPSGLWGLRSGYSGRG